MPKVIYEQTLSRTIEVEVSDEQLAALRGPECSCVVAGTESTCVVHGIVRSDEANKARSDAIDFVVSTAIAHQDEYPLEFSMGYCVDENDEELFDL